MPSYYELIKEYNGKIDADGSVNFDKWRFESLREISKITERNVISYYSSFNGKENSTIAQDDINCLMSNIKGLDKDLGLDLILHTPGGDVSATERIIYYLREKFKKNIRVIIPQQAMSCGTMIALSCKEIIMADHSCIGPVDPYFGELSTYYVVKEFENAKKEILEDESSANYWVPLLNKYMPTAYESCKNALVWSKEIVEESLRKNMFSIDNYEDYNENLEKSNNETINRILELLGNPDHTKNHSRPILKKKAREIGLKIVDLEANQKLQEAVLTYHHKTTITFSQIKNLEKFMENNNGVLHCTFTT